MEAQETLEGDLLTIHLPVALDGVSSPELEERVQRHFSAGARNVILDCTTLRQVTSTSLRIFLLIAKRSKANGGQVRLVGANAHLRQVLDVTRLTPLFGMDASVEAARAALG